MAKTIAILGVTGNQGGSVAQFFSTKGWNVRGITRSSSSAAVTALSSQGIEIVEANLDSPSTLVAAFKGAHVIFAVTDFWEPFFKKFAELSKVSDRATGEYAFGVEVTRGKAVVDAAVEALADGVLERFVFSTLPSFKEQSKGKYTYTYHFDSKAEITKYLKSKSDLWEKSSLLNMGFFTTNMVKYSHLGASNDLKQTGTWVLRTAGSPAALHPFVTPSKDTGIFVDLLVLSPPKQDLLGVSEMESYDTFMKIWTEVTGVPSTVKEISVADADKANPGGIGRETAESFATSAEFGWGNHLVLPTDLDPNVKTTSLSDYIKTEDWNAMLGN